MKLIKRIIPTPFSTQDSVEAFVPFEHCRYCTAFEPYDISHDPFEKNIHCYNQNVCISCEEARERPHVCCGECEYRDKLRTTDEWTWCKVINSFMRSNMFCSYAVKEKEYVDDN